MNAEVRPRRSRLKSAVRIAVIGFVPALIALLGGVGWIGSERAIHPAARHYATTLADYPDLHPAEIGFQSRTHVTIAATFFPGERRAVIVLSHGYGDNQAQMLPYAEFLHKAGYSVLTYDMRNRGRSGGEAVTLGALEYLDLISAVDYLTTRADVDRGGIGALGLSLGGSTTLLAAANDPRIKAVVDDSGFSDAPGAIASGFAHFIGLPAFPFASITTEIVTWRIGVDVKRIRPVDVVARIAPRPLLIVECMGDRVVPPVNGERNFNAAGDPKSIWRIPTGGHIDGYNVARQEYERRVIGFFDESLAAPAEGPRAGVRRGAKVAPLRTL
jgi:fermentation-respiration switch protein FrsA (DUF1100 family)